MHQPLTARPASLKQQAYEKIKRKIVSLALLPGAVIDEAALQEELACGRTPIREALQQLALEKLVVIVPRRGMFVADIGLTDLQRLFEVRVVLESLAAQMAAARGTMLHWRRMAKVLATLVEEEPAVNNEGWIAVDEACHAIIYEAADNEFLRDTCSTLYALSQRLWYFSLGQLGDVREAILEHKAILEALEDGDDQAAAALMGAHIQTFQEEIQSVMLGVRPG